MFEAYVAGFLDADGMVSMEKSLNRHLEHQRFATVMFANADRGILEEIQERWGGHIVARKAQKENHNTSYILKLTQDFALILLRDVMPHMRHQKKKQRALLLLERFKQCTPRNGKYTPILIEQKMSLIEDFFNIQMRGAGAYDSL